MQACQHVRGVPPRFVSKPAGGFRPISVAQVLMAWWAYRSGILSRYLDFRVYLALHEFDEQRRAWARSRAKAGKRTLTPVLSIPKLVAELCKLTGGSSERLVRESLRRLASTRLITLTPTAVLFATSVAELPANAGAEIKRLMPNRTGVRERRLPVPRRVLRYLARGAPASVAATVFGHLIRCAWWRERDCRVAGRCTAGFVSGVFGVDSRSVKRARAELRKVGWLVTSQDPDENTEGNCVPNLLWAQADVARRRRARPPLRTLLSPSPADRRTDLSPRTTCTQLRSGSKYQQRRPRRLTGTRGGKSGDSRPRLSNIKPPDLLAVERLDTLFDEAASVGLVTCTSADRLRFFSAAARALRLGSHNPCGFFAAIVRRGLWHFISQVDEDRAIAQLRADRQSAFMPQNPPRPSRGPTRNPTPHHRRSPDVIAEVQSLVASLAVRCSMEKSPQTHRKYPHDHSPARAPAARVPIGPRSKGSSEASGRGPMGWDAARPCGRAPGGLSFKGSNGPAGDDSY